MYLIYVYWYQVISIVADTQLATTTEDKK